jgi:hypothetical protein
LAASSQSRRNSVFVTCTTAPSTATIPSWGADLEVAERVDARRARRRIAITTAQRPQSRGELLHHERFGDVVVGTGFEPGHDIGGVIPGADDDDRHVAEPAQPPTALETVDPGQHEVEDHDVRWLFGEPVEGVLTVRRLDNGISVVLEGHPQ